MAETLLETFTVEADDGRRWMAHEFGQLVTHRPLSGARHEVVGLAVLPWPTAAT